jgi:hypothetical protein
LQAIYALDRLYWLVFHSHLSVFIIAVRIIMRTISAYQFFTPQIATSVQVVTRFGGPRQPTDAEKSRALRAVMEAFNAGNIDLLVALVLDTTQNLPGRVGQSPLFIRSTNYGDEWTVRIPEATKALEAAILELLESQPEKRSQVIRAIENPGYRSAHYEPSPKFLEYLCGNTVVQAETDRLVRKWDL